MSSKSDKMGLIAQNPKVEVIPVDEVIELAKQSLAANAEAIAALEDL